jgi:hypothetical protein
MPAERITCVMAISQHLSETTTVRLKLEQNQLVDVFGEIGALVDDLKGA